MTSIPNPNAQLTIFKWSNLENRHLPIMTISPSKTDNNNLVTVKGKYADEFNLLGLECNSFGSDLPPMLQDYLPGEFASKLIASQNNTWHRSSDFAKMVKLGNRDLGAFRVIVHEREPMDTSLIRDQVHLDEVINKVHLAVNKDQLNTLLDSRNFYSLTSTRGESPKIEYQDPEGERWVVKTGQVMDGKISSSHAKIEQAFLHMLEDMDVNVPYSAAHTTPEGVEVLMTKRYDLAQPRVDAATGIADHANKFATFSLSTLQKIDAEDTDGMFIESYADAASMIRKHSKEASADVITLLRRGLFDIAVNNTSTHTKNIELVENFNGYQLAPTVGVVPDLCSNRFNMPITAKYTMQSAVSFDDVFVNDVANAFDLPAGIVKGEISKLASIMQNREQYMKFVGMTDDEIQKFEPAFVKDAVWEHVLEQTAKNSPLSMLNRSSILTDDSGASPSLS